MATAKKTVDTEENAKPTLGDVLTVLANGVALQPAEKKMVMEYVEGLDKAED